MLLNSFTSVFPACPARLDHPPLTIPSFVLKSTVLICSGSYVMGQILTPFIEFPGVFAEGVPGLFLSSTVFFIIDFL